MLSARSTKEEKEQEQDKAALIYRLIHEKQDPPKNEASPTFINPLQELPPLLSDQSVADEESETLINRLIQEKHFLPKKETQPTVETNHPIIKPPQPLLPLSAADKRRAAQIADLINEATDVTKNNAVLGEAVTEEFPDLIQAESIINTAFSTKNNPLDIYSQAARCITVYIRELVKKYSVLLTLNSNVVADVNLSISASLFGMFVAPPAISPLKNAACYLQQLSNNNLSPLHQLIFSYAFITSTDDEKPRCLLANAFGIKENKLLDHLKQLMFNLAGNKEERNGEILKQISSVIKAVNNSINNEKNDEIKITLSFDAKIARKFKG